MVMGKGYWLNPQTQQSWTVDKHELWVIENPILSKIPADVHSKLLTLDLRLEMDQIRLAALDAGLIRLRNRSRYWSVQINSNDKSFLRAIAMFLDGIEAFKDTPLVIGNFATQTETTITLRQLLKETLNEELRDNE